MILSSKHHWTAGAIGYRYDRNIFFSSFLIFFMRQEAICRSSCAASSPFPHPPKEIINFLKVQLWVYMTFVCSCSLVRAQTVTGWDRPCLPLWGVGSIPDSLTFKPRITLFIFISVITRQTNQPHEDFMPAYKKMENSLESQPYFCVQVLCPFSLHEQLINVISFGVFFNLSLTYRTFILNVLIRARQKLSLHWQSL